MDRSSRRHTVDQQSRGGEAENTGGWRWWYCGGWIHLNNVEKSLTQPSCGDHVPTALSFLCSALAFLKPELIDITDFFLSKRAPEVLPGGGISISSCSLLCNDLLKQLKRF